MQSPSERQMGYCPEGCVCRGCGASLAIRLGDGSWHCKGCHQRGWPDRLTYWREVIGEREALEREEEPA